MLDTLEQVVPDEVAGLGLKPEAGPQPRRLDVGAVSGLLHPGPRRIVGSAPALLGVEGVAERVERVAPARWRDVEAPAGLEVAARGEDMDVSAAAALAVQHGRPGVAVGFEPGPGRLLEFVEYGFDLGVGRGVVRCPGDHPGGVPVLERQRVGHRSHLMGISPEDLNTLAPLSGPVPLPEEVVRRRLGRAAAAREELNVHRGPGSRREPAPRAPARWR